MRSSTRKSVVLLLLIAIVPVARLMQRLMNSLFDAADVEVSMFAINHAGAALPTLVGSCVVSLLLWWLRACYTEEKLILSISLGRAIFRALNFAAKGQP